MLEIRDYGEPEAREIATWHYEAPYNVYDFESYEEMEKRCSSYVNYDLNIYHTIYEDSKLICVFNLSEEHKETFFGISMHPSFCGKGYSTQILPLIIDYYKTHISTKPLYLQVRVWNERAIKAYEHVGFKIKKRALLKTKDSIAEFYIMRLEIQ